MCFNTFSANDAMYLPDFEKAHQIWNVHAIGTVLDFSEPCETIALATVNAGVTIRCGYQISVFWIGSLGQSGFRTRLYQGSGPKGYLAADQQTHQGQKFFASVHALMRL